MYTDVHPCQNSSGHSSPALFFADCLLFACDLCSYSRKCAHLTYGSTRDGNKKELERGESRRVYAERRICSSDEFEMWTFTGQGKIKKKKRERKFHRERSRSRELVLNRKVVKRQHSTLCSCSRSWQCSCKQLQLLSLSAFGNIRTVQTRKPLKKFLGKEDEKNIPSSAASENTEMVKRKKLICEQPLTHAQALSVSDISYDNLTLYRP